MYRANGLMINIRLLICTFLSDYIMYCIEILVMVIYLYAIAL